AAAAHGAENTNRVSEERTSETRYQGHDIREVPEEKSLDCCLAFERCKALSAFVRQEQRQREVPARVRQCYQHESAARPDVKAPRVEQVPSARPRRYAKLLIAVGQQRFRSGDAGRIVQRTANRRAGAISGDNGRI